MFTVSCEIHDDNGTVIGYVGHKTESSVDLWVMSEQGIERNALFAALDAKLHVTESSFCKDSMYIHEAVIKGLTIRKVKN